MKSGFFITFEGGEGCGKSFHIKALADHFTALGKQCVLTREPGGTEISEKIRDLLLHAKEGAKMSSITELMLFGAARAQHVAELIKPSLNAGKVVICDRFIDSTSAYQGAARNLGSDITDEINRIAIDGCVPNLTVLLDVPVEIGLARAHARDAGVLDRMGAQKLEFYKAVRECYLKIAEKNPNRIVVVDSSGSKEETFQKILKAVEKANA